MPPPSNNHKRDDIRAKIEQELSDPGSRSGKAYRGKRKPQSKGPHIKKSGSAHANPKRVKPGERPPMGIMTTTLWEYPSQHYDDHLGRKSQGSKDYAGASPSWVIWQLLQRYTRTGDTVVDPMCGSGTTLDVCTDLRRKGIGFDLNPQRPEITLADAREIPMPDEAADFVFIDPPYSTHIDYSDDERCIGKLDASAPMRDDDVMMGHAYYESMDQVIAEIDRILKPGKHMGLYVSDSFKKHKGKKGGTFMPIGFELFAIMREYFEPVDIISVVRHNQKLQRGNWHKAAEEQNFFLRGFNYLFIMKKPGVHPAKK